MVIIHIYNRSEGPAQVFLIVLSWMVKAFSHLPREEIKKKMTINMCHLNNLKVSETNELTFINNKLDCQETTSLTITFAIYVAGYRKNNRHIAYSQS